MKVKGIKVAEVEMMHASSSSSDVTKVKAGKDFSFPARLDAVNHAEQNFHITTFGAFKKFHVALYCTQPPYFFTNMGGIYLSTK